MRQFPVYGYLRGEIGRSLSEGRRLSVGAEGFINIGETVSPVAPTTDFNTLYDQYRGNAEQKPSAQFNLYLRFDY